MYGTAPGILDCRISEMPVSVIDFETTGLTPGIDRVVEASVVRVDPGRPPRLAFNSLVDPRRPMAATEIHGITEEDVAGAPSFDEIAGDLVRSLSGSVIASYNVYFDMNFLTYEFRQSGLFCSPPNVCLMYMRPMLGLGRKCSLEDACRELGVKHDALHAAAPDALAATGLFGVYMKKMEDMGLSTFADLAGLKKYRFVESFSRRPFEESLAGHIAPCENLKPRTARPNRTETDLPVYDPPLTGGRAMGLYWDALRTVLADMRVTDAEIEYLKQKKLELGLKDEEVRVVHARAFTGVISQFVGHDWLGSRECMMMHRLYRCLSEAGWAPGEIA